MTHGVDMRRGSSELSARWSGSDAAMPFQRVSAISCAVLAVTFVVIAFAVIWSAIRADDLARARQTKVVSSSLSAATQKIAHDQLSVVVWDDAVQNLKHSFDPQWVSKNLGRWMNDYFKHDRTYLLNARDEIVYADVDNEEYTAGEAWISPSVAKLVKMLRRKIADGALDAYERDAAELPVASDKMFEGERPSIVSVAPIIGESDAYAQTRGSEFLMVSVRYLDGSFVTDLAEQYQLRDAHFETDVAHREELGFPVKTDGGETLGYFHWQPELPGKSIVKGFMPGFVIGIGLVGIATLLLLFKLRAAGDQLAESETQAKRLTYHDRLTALPNRTFLDQHLQSLLTSASRGDENVVLISLDVDRFKLVNDTLGYAAGDELILQLSQRLLSVMPPQSFVARIGSDEFAVVLPQFSDGDVETLCGSILTVVAGPMVLNGSPVVVGVSMGVAIAAQSDRDHHELARKADIALNDAQASGRNQFKIFTESMSDALQKRRSLEVDLREAMENGRELEVVYQPIYSASGVAVDGFEALLRWYHPRLGSVSPLTFICIAEECGLIHQLGKWVLRQACTAAAEWNDKTIAVNVSPRQLAEPDFVASVVDILKQAAIDPRRLEIEITESTLLDATGHTDRTLQALRQIGVKIALDDFGTGYSSLSYIMRHTVDRVKIDRSFVQQIGQSTRANAVILAIVGMARGSGISVTAEGVETSAQQELLRLAGADHLQGFLLSKPISRSDATALLSGTSSAVAAA